MALTAGIVSVSAAGVVTKSGEAGTLFDLMQADAVLAYASFGQSPPTGPAAVPYLTAMARQATTQAAWVVGMLTSRAKARIPAALGGLQLTPTPNDPGVATVASGVDTDLSLV